MTWIILLWINWYKKYVFFICVCKYILYMWYIYITMHWCKIYIYISQYISLFYMSFVEDVAIYIVFYIFNVSFEGFLWGHLIKCLRIWYLAYFYYVGNVYMRADCSCISILSLNYKFILHGLLCKKKCIWAHWTYFLQCQLAYFWALSAEGVGGTL